MRIHRGSDVARGRLLGTLFQSLFKAFMEVLLHLALHGKHLDNVKIILSLPSIDIYARDATEGEELHFMGAVLREA